jgi:glycosyltransferase involved in cell wall biosynthesis
VAYAVFEQDLTVRRRAVEMRGRFDVLAPASRWCEDVLRQAGLKELVTIHQGVDGALFNPTRAPRRRWSDRFVVFSGGKLELRKGQDVVVRAFRIFAERHADALLVASWHNPARSLAATMRESPHVPFRHAPGKSFEEAVKKWLVAARINLQQVCLVPALSHAEFAAVYGNSDVGLFPNRCEGGTNLVMMEYMACGRPVIATDFSGHRDVVTDSNSVRLRSWRPRPLFLEGIPIACWCEPDVEETVAALEEAYQRREYFNELGARAAIDMTTWTWDHAATQFLQILEGSLGTTA